MPLLALSAAALLQVAIPPGPVLPPTEQEAAYQQRLRDYDHSVATVRFFDEAGRDAIANGVFIAPDELVVPYAPALIARRIELQEQCYGVYEATGIIGGDLESGVLILQVVQAEPGAHELAPVELAEGEIDPSHVQARIGFREVHDDEGDAIGAIAPGFYSSDATWVDYAGEPRRLRVPWGEQLEAGDPIFTEAGDLAGIAAEKDGGLTWLVVTADQLREAPRFAAVPPDEFWQRDLSEAEQVARLLLLSDRDRRDGGLQKAAERLQEAVAIAPEHWRAWFKLGVALDMGGKPIEALRALLKSHDLEPAAAEPVYSAGVTLSQMGQGVAGRHYFKAAIERDPRHAWAHANLTAAAMGSGRQDLAVQHMRQAVESAPSEAKYAQMLARLEGELEAAREQLAQAEAAEGQGFAGLLELADLRWAAGEVDPALEAAAAAEQAASNADERLEPRGRRLVWLISLGRYDEATALAGRSAEDLGGHPRAEAIEPFVRKQVELAQGQLDSILEQTR